VFSFCLQFLSEASAVARRIPRDRITNLVRFSDELPVAFVDVTQADYAGRL
jgi:hypothetical protein